MKSPNIWIIDIINATDTLDRLLKGFDFDRFKTDERTQLAILKLIENIGEACNHLEIEFKSGYPDIPWRKIKAMRNQLAHQYWDIDFEVVWLVATKQAQQLRDELKPILHNLSSPEPAEGESQETQSSEK